MTQITINGIQITSSQIIAKINNSDKYFGLFELSQLLREITEKTIVIKSREYHAHNDYESFKNNFMLKIQNLLHDANFNQFPEKYTYKNGQISKQNYRFNYAHWIIDVIRYSDNGITVTIRNIMNERLEDD